MDAGVIASFKAHYRNLFLRCKLAEIEQGNDKSKLNVLQAMQLGKRAWGKVGEEVISSCFRHTQILPIALQAESRVEYKIRDFEFGKGLLDEISRKMSLLGLDKEDTMSVEAYLNPDEEREIERPLSDEEMVIDVIKDLQEKSETESVGEEPGQEVQPYTRVTNLEAQSAMGKVLEYFYHNSPLDYQRVSPYLEKIVDFVDESALAGLTQSKMTDYFPRLSSNRENQ